MRRYLLPLALLAALVAPTVASAQQLVTLVPSRVSGITAVTTTVATFTLPPSVTPTLQVLLNITAGGTATGSMTIFIEDSVDGGTTWNDVISSNAFALGAAVITQHFYLNGHIASTATSGAVDAVETLAAGTTRQGPFAQLMRVREKITGPAGSPVGATYTITAVLR